MRRFAERLKGAQWASGSDVMLWLAPRMGRMPLPMHWQDDPFFPFSKAIIAQTRDVVCGYVFDMAAYLVHGAAGAVALERSIGYAGTDVVRILHGAFATTDYIKVGFEDAFGCDAVTVTDSSLVSDYTADAAHGALVLRRGALLDGQPFDVFAIDAGVIRVFDGDDVLQCRVLGEAVLYRAADERFAVAVREQIQALLHD